MKKPDPECCRVGLLTAMPLQGGWINGTPIKCRPGDWFLISGSGTETPWFPGIQNVIGIRETTLAGADFITNYRQGSRERPLLISSLQSPSLVDEVHLLRRHRLGLREPSGPALGGPARLLLRRRRHAVPKMQSVE